MQERVALPGEIVGNNWVVKCRVSATRVHLDGVPGIFEYAKASIAWVEQDVPNGAYQLRFENRSIRVAKTQNGWIESP